MVRSYSLEELVDVYEDLNSAVFFDGIGEYRLSEKYTPEQWKNKAQELLSAYQEILPTNTTLSKYDYLLREKDIDSKAELLARNPFSRTKSKNQDKVIESLDDEEWVMASSPDEPFGGYCRLVAAMAIPIEALRKTLAETGGFTPQRTPTFSEHIQEIGGFAFILEDRENKKEKYKEAVKVKYRGSSLKLTPKQVNTFYCIMNKCYANEASITIDEIREYNHAPSNSAEYISSIISIINSEIREVTNKADGSLIVRSCRKRQSFETVHTTSYKIANEFAAIL